MSHTVERLKDTGVNAEDYKRGPLGREVFAISVRPIGPEGVVKFWQGNAEVGIDTSTKFRQAVLTVDEPKRSITRRFSYPGVRPVGERTIAFEERMRAKARRQFNAQVNVPAGARFSFYVEQKQSNTFPSTVVEVRATVPRSSQTLLLGMDESYHFIAALPERVRKVEDAHKILKPTVANKPSTVRQGEWFFVPVSKEFNERLHEYARNHNSSVQYMELEAGSAHRAQRLIYRNRVYAIGLVIDRRRGHHTPLWLPKWHRVVRNLETVFKTGRGFRRLARYWD